MRVLVACEYSGRVRDAFIALRHDAMSCDLLPTEQPGPHYQGNIFGIINEDWDLMIAHPPCTHLCSSGARWWSSKAGEQADAICFVERLMGSRIPKIAIENPVGILSRVIGKPTQIIQPWWFGEGEVKTTCLWLKGLPKLVPTNIVNGREQKCWKMPPGENRWKERSRTYQGIANAMALQWGQE